jgi:hypothetical protein
VGEKYAIKDELDKEFGGSWMPLEQGAAARAEFEDTAYAAKLGQWLKKFNVPHELVAQGEKVSITIQGPSNVLECAALACDKLYNTDNSHVTVQSLLERLGPTAGLGKGAKR